MEITNYEKSCANWWILYKHREEDLLREFSFRTGGLYPYSEHFEQCMMNLYVSECYTPVDFKYILIRDKQLTYLKSRLQKFNSEQLELLDVIASDIHNTVEKE